MQATARLRRGSREGLNIDCYVPGLQSNPNSAPQNYAAARSPLPAVRSSLKHRDSSNWRPYCPIVCGGWREAMSG